MPTRYRLHTRIHDLHSLEREFVILDLTDKDFRSTPRLSYYVKHWFNDVDDLIESLSSILNQRITLIVSDLLADITCNILRSIFPQIIQVIIVSKHPCRHQGVDHFSNAQSLVDHLSLVLRDRPRLYITFDSWPIERTSYNLHKHTARYLWYSYFYKIMSRLKNTDVAREEMLESVRAFHKKQVDVVRRSCEEFQQSYNSNDIIQWYTRATFFYLLLNRTLRSGDINHIFSMRYVISDLESYLQKHCLRNHSVQTVYRGQQMHTDEIEEIEANVGGLIGLSAFWSTTYSTKIAFDFTKIWPRERTDSVESVLFTIQIPSHVKRAVYLDIAQFSKVKCEFEVLFSFRSMFRVGRVMRNGHDRFWYIDLTLIDEMDEQFSSIMHPWYSSTSDIISHQYFFTAQTAQSKQNFFYNLTHENGSFLAFQLLVDMMLRLDQNQFSRNELLQVCREHYANDPVELKQIDKFQRTYEPKDAIRWYTTDCFLYRLINRSLRIENIDLIFKLRYFIHDLHNQLAQIQMGFSHQPILRVYRGLRMRLQDLYALQCNKRNLVSMNAFLSTTSDYEAALFFAGNGEVEEDFVSVIYQIDVDTTVKHSVPFPNIEYQSIFKDEDEVLFSMGAVFHVGEIEQTKDRLWTVELTLTSTEDEQWNVLTSHLYSR